VRVTGVVEFGAECGDSFAASGGGGRVEPDVESFVDDLQVPGQGERLKHRGAGLVLAAGVVGSDEPGEGGLGVVRTR